MRAPSSLPAWATQRGAALMVMLVILVMGALTYLVNSLSTSAQKTARQEKTSEALAQAKEALIGYAFDAPDALRRPGSLPYQDRLVPAPEEPATTDGHPNYDGNEDGCPAALPTCLGRLPWRDLGLSISAPSENDSSGIMPWYAFSRNLEQGQQINSNLLNNTTHPWLTVRDMNGNVLSDRVAFVVIIPGSPLPGQSRPAASINPPVDLGSSDQYLDSITVPNGCTTPCVPGSYNNHGTTTNFIMGDEHRWISDPSNPTNQIEDNTYQFNDRLIYVTIDELMPEIVKRVAGEAGAILKSYYSAKNQFPDAALLGSSGIYSSAPGNDSGMLPINLGDCSCSSFTSCSCNFGLVASTAFKRGGSSTWSATNVSGACSRTATQVCTCTGTGYCKNSSGTRNFTCDSLGNCTHNTTSGNFIFTPPSYGTVSSTLDGCLLNGGNAACNASGTFTINLKLPSWFTGNLWQDYFYYHRSNTSSLQAGTQGNIQAFVIGAGAPIINAPFASKGSTQVRPSSNINDYLDSSENTNGNLLFDAANKSRSSSYNDQIFIVAP